MGYFDPPESYDSEIDYDCQGQVGLTNEGEPIYCDFTGAVLVYSRYRNGAEYEGECPKCGCLITGDNEPDDYDGLRD